MTDLILVAWCFMPSNDLGGVCKGGRLDWRARGIDFVVVQKRGRIPIICCGISIFLSCSVSNDIFIPRHQTDY